MSSFWRQWKSPTGRFIRINKKRRFFVFSLVGIFLILGAFGLMEPARAQSALTFGVNQLMNFATWVMFIVARLCIGLTIFALKFFIEIAEYNNYIDTATVKLGWLMVRDVANMFFVVVLLMISFGTILGIESYEWSKTLVKLVLAAVFINFSNLIAQLIIDVAHVFTMTFLNAISATAGGNLISMFKIDKIMAITGQEFAQGTELALELFAASVIAFLLALFMFLILGAYLIIMVARMVVLWVLIILSPLAYIFAVIPQTQEYANKWWSQFNKQVIVAPVIVFFLWLSFATLGSGTLAKTSIDNGGLGFNLDSASAEASTVAGTVGGKQLKKLSISDASSWENLADYIVSLAFLFVGLKVVGELGVVGGGVASGFVSFGKSVAKIATGYMAGRWMYEKGMGVGKKAIGKGLYYMPLVGGEKWEQKAKIVGNAMKGWYYGKGYELKPTERGKQLGAELEERRAELAKQTKEGKDTTPLEEEIQGLEKEFQKEHVAAGGAAGWFARKGIALEKQLAKTEKQAKNRRELIWKRTGSEAGGTVAKVKGLEFGVGMGTKGIGFGRYRIFGDSFGGKWEEDPENLGKMKYKSNEAQDRVERGLFQGEEMRSKAKDDEFEGKGLKEVLSQARIKYDVDKGKVSYESDKETVIQRIMGHRLAAENHKKGVERLEAEARLNLVLGKVKAPATLPGGYQEFLRTQSFTNLSKLQLSAQEQAGLKMEEVKRRTSAHDADARALELETEAQKLIPDRAKPFVDEKKNLEEETKRTNEEILANTLFLEKLEAGILDEDNAEDQKLLKIVGWNPDEDTFSEFVDKMNEDIGTVSNSINRKNEDNNNIILKNNTRIEDLDKKILEEEETDTVYQSKKNQLIQQAEGVRNESAAWRYAQAVADEGLAKKLDMTSHKALLSDAEQREVYDKRGLDTPTSAFGELGEIFKKDFADMPVQSYLGNVGSFLKKMWKRHLTKRGVAEKDIDRAITLGVYMRGFDGAWIDDGVYAMRPDGESKKQFQHMFGWDPDDNIMTLDKLGAMHGLHATGMDLEYVAKEHFVRRLMDIAKEKHGLSPDEVFQGVKTGTFGSATGQIQNEMDELTRIEGGKQREFYETIFQKPEENRKEFYDALMQGIDENQTTMEYMSNTRDAAIKSKHGENAGYYQSYEVDGKRRFIPVGGQMALDYVSGDMNKTDSLVRYAQHFHYYSDVQEEIPGVCGQGVFKIRGKEYKVTRGDMAEALSWERITPKRNKDVSRLHMVNENATDFKQPDADKGRDYYVIGKAYNSKKKRSGMFAMYKHHPQTRELFKGKTLAEQEKINADIIVKNQIFEILQTVGGQTDFLFGMAEPSDLKPRDAQETGKLHIKILDRTYDHINELIDDINKGVYGSFDTQLPRYHAVSSGGAVPSEEETEAD